jgi:hypothetical protein
MSALAHNFALPFPSDQANGEEPDRPSLTQGTIVLAAMTLGVFVLAAAVILQTAYDMLILLWFGLGRPLAFALKTFSRAAGSAIRRVLPHVRRSGGRRRRGQQLVLTFDQLALIFKSLEAIKTLGVLPRQDELLGDTVQIVDQELRARLG